MYNQACGNQSINYFDYHQTQKTLPTARGGNAYQKRSYTIRIRPDFAYPGQDTEALLVKRGENDNLDFVRIRDQDGNTFTEMIAYVNSHADRSTLGVSLPWHCIDVSVHDEWVPGSRFYTLSQPSCEAPIEDIKCTFNSALYKKNSYTVRISPKSSKESWYSRASKEAVITLSDDGDIYRVKVRSSGKYYYSLWGWLKSDPLLPVHEGIYMGHSAILSGCPWEHIDVLVGDGWVDGEIFSVFHQQMSF